MWYVKFDDPHGIPFSVVEIGVETAIRLVETTPGLLEEYPEFSHKNGYTRVYHQIRCTADEKAVILASLRGIRLCHKCGGSLFVEKELYPCRCLSGYPRGFESALTPTEAKTRQGNALNSEALRVASALLKGHDISSPWGWMAELNHAVAMSQKWGTDEHHRTLAMILGRAARALDITTGDEPFVWNESKLTNELDLEQYADMLAELLAHTRRG